MKYLIILTCVIELVVANLIAQSSTEGNIWRRSLLHRRWALNEQDHLRLSKRSIVLQPRADRSRRERSPSISKSKVTAKGPANIYTEAPHGQNRHEIVVPYDRTQSLQRHHQKSTIATASTPANLPSEYVQPLKAEAKGHSAVGVVQTRPGGTGTIRVENEKGVNEIHHVGGIAPETATINGNGPGVAKVVVTSDNKGGSVTAVGLSERMQMPSE